MLAILAVISPGTGLFEIGALFTLFLAAYAVYNIPINLWALLVLLVGVFPFLLAVRRSGKLVYLVVSIAAFVVGSAFLFSSGESWVPAVNPILALAVSGFSAGFLWLAARKVLEAEKLQPVHDLEALVGKIGEARTEVSAEGSVYVAGELWSAHSQKPISEGSRVKVVRREGFILEVEPLK